MVVEVGWIVDEVTADELFAEAGCFWNFEVRSVSEAALSRR
jgi:hypothetical protein